jgi:hypothetical protein
MSKLLIVVFLLLSLSACSVSDKDEKNIQADRERFHQECLDKEKDFSDFAWAFKSQSYLNWCLDCLSAEGRAQISPETGPYCNRKSSDSGQNCSDSNECQGFCLASSTLAQSGTCSGYQELEEGCGLVLYRGQSSEICVGQAQ